MGGAMGNPIDDAAQERINNLIQEVVEKFTVEFAKSYTQSVIRKAKNEVEHEITIEDNLKLQTPPVATKILKTGMLTKRGDSVKSWKVRFFVAYNEKDNFKIDYIDGVNETGKLKGTIFCAGYRAYRCGFDELAEIGDFGIKLVPWSYRRRTWYIKCADEAEQKEWLGVFENACYKAKPPHDEDICIATAFDNTVRNLRWHYWFWGWYSDAGAEGERLGEFILDLLDREIINEILGNIIEGPAKQMTVDLVRKTIGSAVKTAASSAWVSSVTAIRSMSTTVQSSVKDLLAPLLEKQKIFKDKITESVLSTVNPFLSTKGSEVLSPILNMIFRPVTEAFIYGIKGFHAKMTEKITSNEFSSTKFTNTLEYVDWSIEWWSGPLHKGYAVVYQLYQSDLATLASLFAGGVTPYTVYQVVCDKLKQIVHRAVYTFGELGKTSSEGELPAVLAHVTSLLFHDCLLMVKSVIMKVLTSILDAPLQENVIAPCKKLVEPIQSTIDEIPIPGLSILFDLPVMLGEVVRCIEEGAIDALVSGCIADVKSNMTVAAAEIGIDGLKIIG